MTPAKLKVHICFFSYGGNGGFKSEHPDVRDWAMRTITKINADDRVEAFSWNDIADCPITMTRNQAVLDARAWGADVLIMVDSDQGPDYLLGRDPDAVPFWDSCFDFLYKRYPEKMTVIASPYCGPPVWSENVYVFRWSDRITDNPNDTFSLEPYTREEASQMSGIHECAALPTGLIMFDMRVFDVTDPQRTYNRLIRQGVHPELAKVKARPWFYYEYGDVYESKKGSTEDVTATRDISLGVYMQEKYNPLFCNWSAWAAHHKPKAVGKPAIYSVNHIGDKLKTIIENNRDSRDKLVDVSFSQDIIRQNGHNRLIEEFAKKVGMGS